MLSLPQIVHKIATDSQFRAAADEGLLFKDLDLAPSALALLQSALKAESLQKNVRIPDEFPDESGWAAFPPVNVFSG